MFVFALVNSANAGGYYIASSRTSMGWWVGFFLTGHLVTKQDLGEDSLMTCLERWRMCEIKARRYRQYPSDAMATGSFAPTHDTVRPLLTALIVLCQPLV
jgi:hypothetical protein